MSPQEIEPLFPSNPNIGDTFTSPDGSRTWQWNGDRWVLIQSGAGGPGGNATQTPWLSDINADEFRLGAVGEIIVGNVSSPFTAASPSVIVNSHGLTWYGFASLSGTDATGITLSTSGPINFSTGQPVTVRNREIVTNPMEFNVNADFHSITRLSDIGIGMTGAGAPAIALSGDGMAWYPPNAAPPMWTMTANSTEFRWNSTTGTGPYVTHLPLKFVRAGWIGMGGEPEPGTRLKVYGDLDVQGGNITVNGSGISAGAGGLDRQIQFNDDGALAGASGTYTSFEWDESQGWLQLVSGNGQMTFASAGGGFIIATSFPETRSLQMYVESFVVACYDDFGEHHGILLLGGNEAGFQVRDENDPDNQLFFRVNTDGFDFFAQESNGTTTASFEFNRTEDSASWSMNNGWQTWRCFVDSAGQLRFASSNMGLFEGVIFTLHQYTGDATFNYAVRLNGIPNYYPGAGSHKLWYDPSDGYTVKFAE